MSTVLVIDPSDTARRIVREHLEGSGLSVSECVDGADAYDRIVAQHPVAVVTETALTGVDGTVLIRLLREDPTTSAIPVVVYTGDESGREHLRAQSAGAYAVLQKTDESLDLLAETVSAAIASVSHASEEGTTGDGPNDTAPSGESPRTRTLIEALSERYRRERFIADVLSRIYAAGASIDSLEQTAESVLTTIQTVFELDIAVLCLRYEREARVYILPGAEIFAEETKQFVAVALDDFSRRPGTEMVRSTAEHLLLPEEREEFDRLRIDGKRVSSYHTIPLVREGELIGTIHCGHLSNNYFTGKITHEIDQITTPATIVLGNSLRYSVVEERRGKIRSIFTKFVPEEVITDLLSQSESTEMAVGEKRTVAILFSDIRSFTVISEHNSAEVIVSFLNTYLERMVRIIRRHGGYVDKFIGDAILAIFGAPVSYEDNAARAVRAAQEMAAGVTEIDVEGIVLPPGGFATGIGVHEGTVIVGNIGSQDKFDYTVIGDNVNLASRLEGLTKHYHASVLLSDVVHDRILDEVGTREVDTVRVKGKETPTTLYTPVEAGTIDDESAQNYKKGLSMYKLGNWTTATDYFQRVSTAYPKDFLAQMYIQRCSEFAKNPPDPDWGGAITLDFK